MKKRQLIRGEKHHWWPESLSQYWINDDGHIHRLDGQGNVSSSSPKKLGRIGDAHNVIFRKENATPWDQTFEHHFDRPDSNFPRVVEWLRYLAQEHKSGKGEELAHGYRAPKCAIENVDLLIDCLASLVVRSPNLRSAVGRFVAKYNSGANSKEIKKLIGLNLLHSYRDIANALRGSGKIAVFVSAGREFIFGDGFYHNFSSHTVSPIFGKMLVPLTPELAVLYACPMEYSPEPRLVTNLADADLVYLVNETVQIYASQCIFYRSERPELSEHFCGAHLELVPPDPIEYLISTIPGAESWSQFSAPMDWSGGM